MSHDTALGPVRNRLSDTILTGISRCTYTLVVFCKISSKNLLSGHIYLPWFPYNSYLCIHY